MDFPPGEGNTGVAAIDEETTVKAKINQDNRRKILFITVTVVIVLFMAFPIPVSAAEWERPQLTINVTNLPEGDVYLDLLIDKPPVPDGEAFLYGDGQWGDVALPADYDPDIIAILKAYNVDGWRPALVTGTELQLFGELKLSVSGGEAASAFTRIAPNRFKIIAVTENGDIAVSNLIEKKNDRCVIDFDFSTGVAKERIPVSNVIKQFAIMLPVMLAIKALVTRGFRFSVRLNLKPFLTINLCTLGALSLGVAYTSLSMGWFFGLMAFFGIEAIIFIAEAILFTFLLKEHSKPRRAGYSVVANAAGLVAGLITFFIIWVL